MLMWRRLTWVLLIATVWVVFCPVRSHSQPSVDNVQTATLASTTNTLTISNLVVGGSNRGIAVCALGASSTGVEYLISSVAFNGSETFTKIAELDEVSGTIEWNLAVYYLANPTATTANVVVTYSGSSVDKTKIGSAHALSGMAQSNPTLSGTNSCSSCSSISTALVTTVDNTLLVACGRHSNSTNSWTHGTGQTETADIQESGATGESFSSSWELKVTAGSETLTGNGNKTNFMGYVAMGAEPFVATSSRRGFAPWFTQ